MGKYATKEQLTALVADMASKINIASGTQGVSGSYVPIGCIEAFMGVEAPPDFLVCDGSLHSIAAYPQLADHFYEQFGASNYFGGNGTTTFGVPNSTEWDTPTVPPNDTPVLWCIKAIDEKIQPGGGGGIDYSTEEQDTGLKWIDGKPVYQKTISAILNSLDQTIPHEISNLSQCVSVNAVTAPSTVMGQMRLIPNTYRESGWSVGLVVTEQNVILQLASDYLSRYSDHPVYITLRYTKTTDG